MKNAREVTAIVHLYFLRLVGRKDTVVLQFMPVTQILPPAVYVAKDLHDSGVQAYLKVLKEEGSKLFEDHFGDIQHASFLERVGSGYPHLVPKEAKWL